MTQIPIALQLYSVRHDLERDLSGTLQAVAQMGYVMLSIGIGLRWKSLEAVQVGFLLLFAHAVMKGLAFLCKGTCSFYATLRGAASDTSSVRRPGKPSTCCDRRSHCLGGDASFQRAQ